MPLSRRTDYGDSRFAGCEVDSCSDLDQDLQRSLAGGFDFLLAPLERQCDVPKLLEDGISPIPSPPVARSEFLLNSTQWSSQVVGSVSGWLDLDSADPRMRAASEAQLRKELGWAFHLSLQAVVMPTPKLFSPNYARVVQQICQSQHGSTQMWLRIPLVAASVSAVEGTPEEEALHLQRDESTRRRPHDPWEWWDTFRHLCDGSKELGAVVEVGPSLPTPKEWRRWLGEPLRAVLLSSSAFTTNKRGFPVLPKAHQDFLAAMFSHNIQVILTGPARHECPSDDPVASWESASGAAAEPAVAPGEAAEKLLAPKHPLHLYLEYLMYIFKKLDEIPDQQLVEMAYRDYLQAPLQPLADNLESQTYEVFEKDATKYNVYEEAVFRALGDRSPGPDGLTTLMVVGAGRGPLVKASLRAAARAHRKLRVYAVEKNVNAIMHLRCLYISEKWEGVVSIISHDMRTWTAPEQADILVSELLGSFGDNELSPECLDGAQRFLKPDGISIPQAYTSFIAPMTGAKLHNDCKAYKDLAHLETPYVVKLHRHFLVADPLPVYTFVHPNPAVPIDNSRYIELEFERTSDDPGATIHGFGGYFDAQLYKDVHLSIYPPTHTPNMFSWFPVYFPLARPVHVPQGANVKLNMWRCGDAGKVWYEWALSSPAQSHVHNSGGRSYFVGLG